MYTDLIGEPMATTLDEGNLYALEGTDCSFKNTVCKGLVKYLAEKGIKSTALSYPIYNHPTNIFVDKMLAGAYGSDPKDIPPMVGALGFMLQRMDDFQCNWKEAYNNKEIIISDRYSGSNVVHQATKLSTLVAQLDCAKQILHIEHNQLLVPRPTKVVFLAMHPDIVKQIKEERGCGHTGGDVHEASQEYLVECYTKTLELVSALGWVVVYCFNKGDMSIRSREEILADVIKVFEL